MQIHRTHRACKEGVFELLAKQFKRGIRGAALTQGVHVHPDVRPLIIVADRRVAHALGTGAGDLVFAGHAVAHRAGLAVFADALPRIGQHFSIVHTESILLVFHFCGRKCPAAALSAPHHSLVLAPRQGLCTPFARLLSFCSTMVRHFEKNLIFFKKILDKTAGFRYYSGAPRAPAQRQNKRCGKMAELV